MTTRTEKARIKQYVLDHYSDRNPRNIRVRKNGAVEARVQTEARRAEDEQIFCGWDTYILCRLDAIESIEANEERRRRIDTLTILTDAINHRFDLGSCGLVVNESGDKYVIADDQWTSRPVPYAVALASLEDAANAEDYDDMMNALYD